MFEWKEGLGEFLWNNGYQEEYVQLVMKNTDVITEKIWEEYGEWYETVYRKEKYWKNITEIYKKQRAKGMKTYGQGLEDNTDLNMVEVLEYLQEELVDALMYCEHLKAKMEGSRDDNDKHRDGE